MMNAETIASGILDFLMLELLAAQLACELEIDDSLFELGLIDSLVVLKIIAFCEDRFEVKVPDAELMPENFETVRAMAAMVARLNSRA
jgi:acyl carrier protein